MHVKKTQIQKDRANHKCFWFARVENIVCRCCLPLILNRSNRFQRRHKSGLVCMGFPLPLAMFLYCQKEELPPPPGEVYRSLYGQYIGAFYLLHALSFWVRKEKTLPVHSFQEVIANAARNADNSRGVVSGQAKPVKQVQQLTQITILQSCSAGLQSFALQGCLCITVACSLSLRKCVAEVNKISDFYLSAWFQCQGMGVGFPYQQKCL